MSAHLSDYRKTWLIDSPSNLVILAIQTQCKFYVKNVTIASLWLIQFYTVRTSQTHTSSCRISFLWVFPLHRKKKKKFCTRSIVWLAFSGTKASQTISTPMRAERKKFHNGKLTTPTTLRSSKLEIIYSV